MYPHHFESPNFFGDHALLPSCFRRWCIWKQKILPSEIHESLQWDAGAPEGIRTPDPQIRSLVHSADNLGQTCLQIPINLRFPRIYAGLSTFVLDTPGHSKT